MLWQNRLFLFFDRYGCQYPTTKIANEEMKRSFYWFFVCKFYLVQLFYTIKIDFLTDWRECLQTHNYQMKVSSFPDCLWLQEHFYKVLFTSSRFSLIPYTTRTVPIFRYEFMLLSYSMTCIHVSTYQLMYCEFHLSRIFAFV